MHCYLSLFKIYDLSFLIYSLILFYSSDFMSLPVYPLTVPHLTTPHPHPCSQKACDPCGWIMEKLQKSEEEENPTGRPAVSNNLDPRDLSDIETKTN